MPARILIADDDPPIRRLLRRLLEEHAGLEVCGEAVDGHEAVVQVSQLHPDVVVMDLAMPRMNGIQAAREIAAVKPTLPMILLTVQGMSSELIDQARKAGFRGAVCKSKGSEVVDAIMKLLNNQTFFAA